MDNVVERYGNTYDLSYEHKTTCPKCESDGMDRSGDNLHIYGLDENGEHRGANCFACGYVIPSVSWLRENGKLEEKEYNYVSLEFNDKVHEEIKDITTYDSKGYRGVSKETSKHFGVRYSFDEHGNVIQVYYPTTKDFNLSGYKTRIHPKDFSQPYGVVGKDADLFMQFRFKNDSGKYVVIASGEHDALAAFQMLKNYTDSKGYAPTPVVSSTVGETSSPKQIQANYEWFNRFEKIILCPDQDDVGQKVVSEIAAVLPKGKTFVMTLPLKDANDMLEKGREREFVNQFFSAKPYVPEGVKSADDAFDEIEQELMKERITLPTYMHKMQEMMGGGMIQGRIANIIAYTSTGKSSHVNRMVYHWIFTSPVTPTIISLEATAGQYMLELLSIHMQQNLRWNMNEQELINFLKTDKGQQLKQELCYKESGEPRFYIIDEREGSIKDLEKTMERLFRKHESKLFVIDVLSDLLRGSGEEHSEDHMHFQRTMVKNGVTIINVLHTRKPKSGDDGREKKVSEYDALGTGSFVQSAAYNIVMNRDKLAEDVLTRNTTEVELPKCRGGKTGPAGFWYYDFPTATCYDLDDWMTTTGEINSPSTQAKQRTEPDF